ncbi:MAG: hypothetical protein H6739_15280 [Alphaproteobacteria bacterium]|nr:hypothetical protein [Alphaproteobacteria bacterium]
MSEPSKRRPLLLVAGLGLGLGLLCLCGVGGGSVMLWRDVKSQIPMSASDAASLGASLGAEGCAAQALDAISNQCSLVDVSCALGQVTFAGDCAAGATDLAAWCAQSADAEARCAALGHAGDSYCPQVIEATRAGCG